MYGDHNLAAVLCATMAPWQQVDLSGTTEACMLHMVAKLWHVGAEKRNVAFKDTAPLTVNARADVAPLEQPGR